MLSPNFGIIIIWNHIFSILLVQDNNFYRISYQTRQGVSSNNSSDDSNGLLLDASTRENASNDSRISNTSMKTISMEEYIKLSNDSVELCRARITIDKLAAFIEKKDVKILQLEEKLKYKRLSAVSLWNVQLYSIL